jgi:hypothetical protein
MIQGGLGSGKQGGKKRKASQILQIQNSYLTKENITFTDEELVPGASSTGNALIVSMIIANREVRRIFVDSEASSDILFYDAFIRMGLKEEDLTPVDTSVYGLGGPDLTPVGMIDLLVIAGTSPRLRTETVTFLVLKMESAYNVIMGQPTIDAFKMVISLPHQRAKFKTENGVGEI